MKTLNPKPVFELPHEYRGLKFLSCSLDYKGNPNILFVKGEYIDIDEEGLYKLKSEKPLDFTLMAYYCKKNT